MEKRRGSISIWFVKSVALLLFYTAIAKIISYFLGKSTILERPNELFNPITNKTLMLLVAVFELSIVFCLNCKIYFKTKIYLIIILNTIFLAYRAALHSIGYKGSCACLGEFFDWLHIKNSYLSPTLYLLIAYMLTGSYYFLAVECGLISRTRFEPKSPPRFD